jgi:hypothetical protein
MKKDDLNIDKYGFGDDNQFYKKELPIDLIIGLLEKLIDSAPNDIKWPDREKELKPILKAMKEYKNV